MGEKKEVQLENLQKVKENYFNQIKEKVFTRVELVENIGENHYYFLGELLHSMNLNQYSTAAAQPGISVEQIKNLFIPLPPLAEQQAIAAYLDRECAQIDTLVAAQHRLIALLKEQRQALIAHTVTQGLDPAAPRKDSGVAWLGQVPAHWEVVQLKRVLSIQNGSDYKHIQVDEGYPVIGSGGIFAYASNYMFDGETILLGRKGTIDRPIHFSGKFWLLIQCFGHK